MKLVKKTIAIVVNIDGTEITVHYREDGWLEGSCRGYRFWAVVADISIGCGIESGRVLMLDLRRDAKRSIIAYYQLGWFIRPNPLYFGIYFRILRALDTMPLQSELDKQANKTNTVA